MIKARSN